MALPLDIVVEGAGWPHADVGSDDCRVNVIASSMCRAFEDLADSALALLYGASFTEAVWWEEPCADRSFEYVHWVAQRDGDTAHIELQGSNAVSPLDGERHLHLEADLTVIEWAQTVSSALARAFDGYTEDDWTEAWADNLSDVQSRVGDLERGATAGLLTDPVRRRLEGSRVGDFGAYRSDLLGP